VVLWTSSHSDSHIVFLMFCDGWLKLDSKVIACCDEFSRCKGRSGIGADDALGFLILMYYKNKQGRPQKDSIVLLCKVTLFEQFSLCSNVLASLWSMLGLWWCFLNIAIILCTQQ
jgi:hypothetical protein